MPPLQEPKYKILRRLPQEIQDVITSVESPVINQAIGVRYALSQEKIAVLAEDIGLTLLGLVPAVNFVGNLQKHLLVSRQQAERIGKDVNEKTFNPIQQPLKKLHNVAVWDIGMGPEPELYAGAPSSVWSAMEKKRKKDSVVNLFDTMVRLRENT